MKKLKNRIRKSTPRFLLSLYRKIKKKRVNNELAKQAKKGGLSKIELINQLKAIGIQPGDSLLVHSAMSKIGYIEGGAQTLIDALLELVGKNGNLLMPTSPNNALQLDFAKSKAVFDVLNTPSKLGKLTEVFRKTPNAVRSLHPTEPISAIGKDAFWFTSCHHLSTKPYGKKSPWFKLVEKKAKILYIGCTLDNAGTSLHCLEDSMEDFKFPIYYPKTFDFEVLDWQNQKQTVVSKIHNPVFSEKRKCDDLLPMFLENKVAKKVKIGAAKSYLFDAEKMFCVMKKMYLEKGVTMYTPEGS